MVAYLKKPEGSKGFHQIVDFLNASHIRYALIENPTIYVFLIKQFYETTTARTLDNGEIELTATIDGKGLVVQGEGSTHPVESHHTPTGAPSTLQPPISSTFRRTNKQEYVVPQPRSPTQSPVADEAASTSVDVRYGGATTTVTSLEAGHGSGNIDKTPTMPHDSPPLRKVESLETDLKQTKLTYGAAYTKLIKKERKIAEIDQDPTISLVQHDAEIQGRHEHDMEFDFDLDAAKDVSTAKKDVSTVKPVSTTGATITTASVTVSTAKDKGKAKMDESESKTAHTKTKLQQKQERLSYEEAIRLQAKLEEEERRFTLKALGSTGRSSELEIILRERSTELTDGKEREIWVELKRLFEPNTDDELWRLQNHIHDLTWRLYDSCGVHHMSTEKGIEIYILVEKEYPLSRGSLTLMLVAKLLMDQDNEIY
ncbi:hypothetical protein Tco_0843092 [Tanacetum coccineum]|uniref:Uncharacterized protein n=1 Tax=Tanacetum coccineum TaxID=301880 RepID=A0ABQ5B181_9ASTR